MIFRIIDEFNIAEGFVAFLGMDLKLIKVRVFI